MSARSEVPERACPSCGVTFRPPLRGRGRISQGLRKYCTLSCRSKDTNKRIHRDRFRDPMVAIEAKATVTSDGCWEWGGYIGTHGYGSITYKNERLLVHRLAYETMKGPIPADKVIDHLCRNRWCVNPDHLEVVTQRENVHRGDAGPTLFCKRGHERTPENTIVHLNGDRQCRICRRMMRKLTAVTGVVC